MENNIQKWMYDTEKNGDKLSPVSCFRRKIHTEKGTVQVRISALGLYVIKIDGIPLTDDIFLPGWCDYRYRAEYRIFEKEISSGEHTIDILLADGWYAGFIAGKEPAVPELFAELTLPDGTVVTADNEWQCASDGPFIYSDIYMGEKFDFNRSFSNFRNIGIKERQLSLEPFEGNPVRRIRTVKVQKRNGNIIDFGENLTGRTIIKFTAPSGTLITVRHAEVLDEQGRLYTKNLRAAEAAAYVIASGNEDTYEAVFTFFGFRYVEVSGIDDFDIEAVSIHSDMPQYLKFNCSDELLNKLVGNIRRGWLGNALDIPTDCPQRDERVGWLGDAQVFIKAALYLTDCSKFFRRWLKDVRLGRNDEGFYGIVVPEVNRFMNYDAAGWSDAGVICPYEIYNFTKDKNILAENYDAMFKFAAARHNNFKKGEIPAAKFGDWLNLNDDTPSEIIGCAFLAYSTGLVLESAKILGRNEDAALLEKYFNEQKEFFNKNYAEKLETQTGLSLALDFELLFEENRSAAAAKLNKHVTEKRNTHLCTGFLGTPHLLHALSKNAYTDTAWALLEQKTFPSWLFPVLNGATTVWEHWDSWTPEKGFQDPVMNSFNHYAYGAVLDWIIGVAAGITPDLNIDPHAGGTLSFMEVEFKGVYVRWDKDSNTVNYTVKVPSGVSAKFRGMQLENNKVYHFSEKITTGN